LRRKLGIRYWEEVALVGRLTYIFWKSGVLNSIIEREKKEKFKTKESSVFGWAAQSCTTCTSFESHLGTASFTKVRRAYIFGYF